MATEQSGADSTTVGSEPSKVALRRRRDRRTDHVHEIPFDERTEVCCPDCGETTAVGIYGSQEVSYGSCWTWDCDAFHKFRRDRDAETTGIESNTVQAKLVTDGGMVQSANKEYCRRICKGGGVMGCASEIENAPSLLGTFIRGISPCSHTNNAPLIAFIFPRSVAKSAATGFLKRGMVTIKASLGFYIWNPKLTHHQPTTTYKEIIGT